MILAMQLKCDNVACFQNFARFCAKYKLELSIRTERGNFVLAIHV